LWSLTSMIRVVRFDGNNMFHVSTVVTVAGDVLGRWNVNGGVSGQRYWIVKQRDMMATKS
jgi:hypothetical protein